MLSILLSVDVREALLSPPNSGRHPWETARIRIVTDLLKKSVPQLWTRSSVVTDIGCGDCFVIRTLATVLPQARFYGADSALAQLGVHDGDDPLGENRVVLYCDANACLAASPGPIDVVLLLDVIEHVDNDVDFLSSLVSHRSVTADTVILVTVPAFQFLFSSHDHLLDHRRRYSVAQLVTSLSRAGIEPLRTGCFFLSLFFARLMQVTLQRLSGTANRTGGRGIAGHTKRPFIDACVEAALMLDYKLFSSGPLATAVPGLSVFCICKKKPR